MNNPVVIVGAGLTGLRAASLLTAQGIPCRVLEARERIGGRVLSTTHPNGPDLGKFDLGPTWFWPAYEPTITQLVKELHLGTFAQYTKGTSLLERQPRHPPEHHSIPENASDRAMRFTGGVHALIEAISDTLPRGIVELETRVTAIRRDQTGAITLEVEHSSGTKTQVSSNAVILALPPRIVARDIEFSPSLPENLLTNLMDKPTWMAGQAKVVAIYDRPFWRESGLSGFARSWVGPLQEIHDASPELGSGALFGFFGLPAKARQKLGQDRLLELVIDQLVRLFGPKAQTVDAFLYKDWSRDSNTAVLEDLEPLTDYPNYGRPTTEGVWENKLVFAGTETNAQHGGHLEGALQSAEQAVHDIKNGINNNFP